MSPRHIELRGARTHNLRGVDVDLPHGAITVVTGVSGSGKSSLALDTLYAEAQRRFVESMSAYARQYLERLERPPMERLDFVPPAIAIGQTSRPRAARTTVGTMSQVSDLLQLLWGAVAEPECPRGHGPIRRAAPSSARAALVARWAGARAVITTTVPGGRESARGLVRDGWPRVLDDVGAVIELDPASPPAGPLRVVIDRLKIADDGRLAESLGAALRVGGGRASVWLPEHEHTEPLSERLECAVCGFVVPERSPRLFSAQSAMGACATCEGFGAVATLDPEKVVPDPTRTLLQDAIAPWSTPRRAGEKRAYHALARDGRLRLTVPWQDLSEAERQLVWGGDPGAGFGGVARFFATLEAKRYKMGARILVARYRGWAPCETCAGTRLRPESLAYRVAGRSIADAAALPFGALGDWLAGLTLAPEVEPLRRRAVDRTRILEDVGLDYLCASREGRSLSTGEARRIHLASALGAGVTGTMYVLDEPSVGLHPRDTRRLIGVLRRLAETGNTVVVVEHDPDLIAAADHVVELGPGAGRRGGQLCYAGPPSALLGRDTPTARALAGPGPGVELVPFAGHAGRRLWIRGACARTLRDLDLDLALGALNVITGVSGSGKSTLLHEVLAHALPRVLAGARPDRSRVRAFEGHEALGEVHVIDASPLARSARSIPATYVDAWGPIRTALAQSADARRLGLSARDFSFNSGGGRCETCEGLGTVTVDMQFLADVTVTCEACGGRRFRPRVLEARWRGLDVAQLLDTTVAEVDALFAEQPAVRKKLAPLLEAGLGYLVLGQTTSTLSGGEAQRLKLAAHLAGKGRANALLLLDEPTTGLHQDDVLPLLRAFGALLDRGATLVVVEHHPELIRHAHHLIDLGPEGGEGGGRLVARGSLNTLLASDASHTAQALAAYLGSGAPP